MMYVYNVVTDIDNKIFFDDFEYLNEDIYRDFIPMRYIQEISIIFFLDLVNLVRIQASVLVVKGVPREPIVVNSIPIQKWKLSIRCVTLTCLICYAFAHHWTQFRCLAFKWTLSLALL